MKKIILASSSPRRKKLLEQMGLEFSIEASNIIEKLNPRLRPRGNAEQLSLQKARAVAERYIYESRTHPSPDLIGADPLLKREGNKEGYIIIAADTFVVLDDEIIGKPQNKNDARRILRSLSGRMHLVVTGFTIIDTKNGKTVTKSAETKVYFKRLSNKEIDQYIKTGEPMDKAGAYGIQDIGGVFIKKIEGEWSNIAGLPICMFYEALRKFGINCLL
jgi:septum formation protein